MIRTTVIACAMAVAAPAAPVDTARLVDALRIREGWRGQDGKLGERGPWQLRLSVWSMHMPAISYSLARDAGTARACAVKHVTWLAEQLVARGVDPSAFNIALAWNAGFNGAVHGRAPVRAYNFAVDVAALYIGATGQNTVNSPVCDPILGSNKSPHVGGMEISFGESESGRKKSFFTTRFQD